MTLLPTDGWAGSTGKINGVVKDAQGEALPGVNVILAGTRQGATTDAEGYFFILNIDPGSHDLEASLIGFNTERMTGVLVRADFTTKADFELKEAAIELGEIVVVAKRAAVEPDKTMSLYIVGAEDIQNVPLARSPAEVIELLPGVSLDGNLRIRGSHTASRTSGTNEIFVEIDGVRLANDDGMSENNAVAQVNSISRGALQEVQVLAGGMDAEYGNAQGGVVRMVSAEAKDRFSGGLEYRGTLPGLKHWGENAYDSAFLQGRPDYNDASLNHEKTNYDDKIGNFWEANLSGPISGNVGFFASSKSNRSAPIYPNAINGQPFNIQNSLNLTHRPSTTLKFKLGGTLAYSDGFADGGGNILGGPGGSVSGTPPGGTRGISQKGSNLFIKGDFSAAGKSTRTDAVLYAVATHTISPKTFYEVRLSWQNTKLDTSGVPAATGDIVRDANGFYDARDIHAFTYADRGRLILKADLSSQASKGHFFKTGFEIIRSNLYQHEETFVDTRSRSVRLVGQGDPVQGMDAFNPITYAAYVQDKMEFEGLVVNAGVRLDVMDPGSSYGRAQDQVLWNHYNSLTRWRGVPVVDSPRQTAISPRLGISHPVTERSTIRFFTGRFFQFTQLQHLYNREFRSTQPDKDLNGNGQIDQAEIFNSLVYPLAGEFGNINMKPERTTNFEVGVDWNFTREYVLGATAFYKDQEGVLSSGGSDFFLDDPFKGFNSSYTHGFFNRRFSTSRGLELSFKKAFSHMTAFNVSYNLNWSKSNRGGLASWEWFIVPTNTYVQSDKFFAGVDIGADGQETPHVPTQAERDAFGAAADGIAAGYKGKSDAQEPKSVAFWEQPVRLDDGLYSFNIGNYNIPDLESGVDRRNFAAVQFLFSAPPDFHVKPLAGFRASVVWQMQSGTPWTYTPPAGPAERRKGPVSTLTDVSFERDFGISSSVGTAFLEVRNLFGQRDDTGTGFNWVQYGLQQANPGDSKFTQFGDINELTRYNGGLGRPRNIVIGARLKF